VCPVCANGILPSIKSSFVCKTKEGRYIIAWSKTFVSNSNQTCVIIYIWNVMIQVIFCANEWYPFSIGILKIILINTFILSMNTFCCWTFSVVYNLYLRQVNNCRAILGECYVWKGQSKYYNSNGITISRIAESK
jgi:hypothetical protein